MTLIPFPRHVLQSAQWQQAGGRLNRQRSAFTGRGPELDFGTAARWQVTGEVVPTNLLTRTNYAAFDAACQVPGAEFRLPAVEQSQYGDLDNMILNPEFVAGSAPWVLGSAWNLVETGAPPSFPQAGLYTDSTRAANSATANGAIPVTVAAGQALFLSCDAFRSVGSTGTLSMAANFLNSGGSLISTLGLDIVAVATAGSWQRVYATLTAPVGTVSAIVYFNNGLTAGFGSVTGARASLWPERIRADTGSAGRSLNLRGMIPSVKHASAGDFLTVFLPSGDEQLVRLTADLQASISGTATALLATPLREVPAFDATVEIARPWGLMRATHLPGWEVTPGRIYGHEFSAEESY